MVIQECYDDDTVARFTKLVENLFVTSVCRTFLNADNTKHNFVAILNAITVSNVIPMILLCIFLLEFNASMIYLTFLLKKCLSANIDLSQRILICIYYGKASFLVKQLVFYIQRLVPYIKD